MQAEWQAGGIVSGASAGHDRRHASVGWMPPVRIEYLPTTANPATVGPHGRETTPMKSATGQACVRGAGGVAGGLDGSFPFETGYFSCD